MIRDPESDHTFLQRLKESREYWDLDEVPSYMKPQKNHKKLKCATCKLNKHPKNHTEMLKDLTHDVINLLAYYHDCEDKDKEYECKYCVDEFNGVLDEEAERYACPSSSNPEECGCDECEMACRDYSSEEDYSYEDEDEDEEDPEEKRERMKLERKREKAFKKRNQREHMAHLKKEHEKKLRIILYFK